MDQGTEGRRPRKVSDIYRGRVRQDGPIIVQTGELTLATGQLQIESEENRLENRVDDEEDEENEGGGEKERSACVRSKAEPRDPAQEGQQNLGGDVPNPRNESIATHPSPSRRHSGLDCSQCRAQCCGRVRARPKPDEFIPEGRLEVPADRVIEVGENFLPSQGLRDVQIAWRVGAVRYPDSRREMTSLCDLGRLTLHAGQVAEQLLGSSEVRRIRRDEHVVRRKDDPWRHAGLRGTREDPPVVQVGSRTQVKRLDPVPDPTPHEIQSVLTVPPPCERGGIGGEGFREPSCGQQGNETSGQDIPDRSGSRGIPPNRLVREAAVHRGAAIRRDEVLRDIGEWPANTIAADDRRTDAADVPDVAQQGLELRPGRWRGETVLGEEGLPVPETGLHLSGVNSAIDLRRVGHRAQKLRALSRSDGEVRGIDEIRDVDGVTGWPVLPDEGRNHEDEISGSPVRRELGQKERPQVFLSNVR